MTKKQLLADRQALLDEIAALQAQNLALRLGEASSSAIAVPDSPAEDEARITASGVFSRFPLLRAIDEEYSDSALPDAAAAAPITLSKVAEHLRRYAAAHFGIYAGRALFAHFLGAMAVADFILLRSEIREAAGSALLRSEGREAAGSALLRSENAEEELPGGSANPLLFCRAVAAALGRDLDITRVQPHWSRSSDLLGEAGQGWQYHETDFLRALYAAGWQEAPCFAVLDNIAAANPDGYLRALVPVLSLRRGAARSLSLVGAAWPGDPVLLREGALPWPENLWLFGTVSQGAPTPNHLRASAMEFCLPAKAGRPAPIALAAPLDLPAQQLRGLFVQAEGVYALPEEPLRLAALLEEYLAEHMELSLGAQTGAQLRRFCGVCLACGLKANDALDGYFYHKALRRLEDADPDTVKYELPGLRRFIKDTFGRNGLPLAAGYLQGLG